MNKPNFDGGSIVTYSTLMTFGEDLWLERQFEPLIEKEIVLEGALFSTWTKLDMAYQTYAEGSWTQDVLEKIQMIGNCECDTCYKWQVRKKQIIDEMRYQTEVWYLKNLEYRKKHNPAKEG